MKRIDLSRFDNIPAYVPDTNRYAVKLDANESFVQPPDILRKKMTEAVRNFDFLRYPDPEARELCRVFARAHDLDEKRLTVGNGSDELISILVTALLKPGQKMLTCDPDFSMYRFYAERSGVMCVPFEKSAELELDTEKVVKTAKAQGADMVIFSNPCNPTGRGVARIDVIRLAKALSDRAVVVDEAYMDFWDQSVMDMAGELPNLIVLKTLSKAYGMASLRVGFAVASRRLTDIFKKCKSPYNVTGLSQELARIVLEEDGYVQACIERILAARDKLYSALKELETRFPAMLETLASRTNFVILRSPCAAEIQSELKKRGIIIRYTEGLLRITAGGDAEIAALIENIEAILKEKEGKA